MATSVTGSNLEVGGVPRVNLLPPAEIENRSRRELRLRWLGAFVVAAVLVASVSSVAFGWAVQASDQLVQQRANARALESQLGQYSDIAELQLQKEKLDKMRSVAGSNDLGWTSLANEIKAVLPSGVTLTGFRLAPGAAPQAGVKPADQVGLQGTLTFSAGRTAAQAQTISRLRSLPGLISVDAGALSVGDRGGYTFEATVSLDQTRYTGRFAQKGGK
jgi:hypothetical protein